MMMMMMMISMANNIVTGPSDLLIITYILLLYDVLLWKGLSIRLELKLCNQFSEYGSSRSVHKHGLINGENVQVYMLLEY